MIKKIINKIRYEFLKNELHYVYNREDRLIILEKMREIINQNG